MTTLDLTPPDPRARATPATDGVTVSGWRCQSCAYPVAQPVMRCPVCRGAVAEATFADAGEVWASTCLRVRVPGYAPPFAVAYLVLDGGGPRVLVHTEGETPLVPGTRARITGLTPEGDLLAEPTEGVEA